MRSTETTARIAPTFRLPGLALGGRRATAAAGVDEVAHGEKAKVTLLRKNYIPGLVYASRTNRNNLLRLKEITTLPQMVRRMHLLWQPEAREVRDVRVGASE